MRKILRTLANDLRERGVEMMRKAKNYQALVELACAIILLIAHLGQLLVEFKIISPAHQNNWEDLFHFHSPLSRPSTLPEQV